MALIILKIFSLSWNASLAKHLYYINIHIYAPRKGFGECYFLIRKFNLYRLFFDKKRGNVCAIHANCIFLLIDQLLDIKGILYIYIYISEEIFSDVLLFNDYITFFVLECIQLILLTSLILISYFFQKEYKKIMNICLAAIASMASIGHGRSFGFGICLWSCSRCRGRCCTCWLHLLSGQMTALRKTCCALLRPPGSRSSCCSDGRRVPAWVINSVMNTIKRNRSYYSFPYRYNTVVPMQSIVVLNNLHSLQSTCNNTNR